MTGLAKGGRWLANQFGVIRDIAGGFYALVLYLLAGIGLALKLMGLFD